MFIKDLAEMKSALYKTEKEKQDERTDWKTRWKLRLFSSLLFVCCRFTVYVSCIFYHENQGH